MHLWEDLACRSCSPAHAHEQLCLCCGTAEHTLDLAEESAAWRVYPSLLYTAHAVKCTC